MITVSVKINVIALENVIFRVEIRCPHCGAKLTFSYHITEYCEVCLRKLPDIKSFFDGPGGKIWYHRTGRTFKTQGRIDYFLKSIL